MKRRMRNFRPMNRTSVKMERVALTVPRDILEAVNEYPINMSEVLRKGLLAEMDRLDKEEIQDESRNRNL